MSPVAPTLKTTYTRIDLPFGQLPTREKLVMERAKKPYSVSAEDELPDDVDEHLP